MVNIDLRIANEGMAFYEVGKREYLACSNVENEDLVYKIIPAIVNLSFSIELFLKSMIDNSWGHDLNELFCNLAQNEQMTILQLTIKQLEAWDVECNEKKFYEYLEDNKVVFEDWRYFYQRGKKVNLLFLYALGTVLYNILIVSIATVKNK